MEQLTVGSSRRPARRTSGGSRSTPGTSTGSTRRFVDRVFLETGYGERFGVTDEQLRPLVGGLRDRDRLFADCDVVLLPKPCPATSPRCVLGRCSGGGPTACRTWRSPSRRSTAG